MVLCACFALTSIPVHAQWQATAEVSANSQNVYALASSGSNLFAGTGSAGVSLSSTFGSSWTTVNTGITCSGISTLVVLGSEVFAGGDSGVFKTNNLGTLWTPAKSGLPVTTINTLLVSGTTLYAGTQNNGVFSSVNSGASWNAANAGFTGQVVALTESGSTLFAGAPNNGVFVSQNNGGLWTAVNNGLTNTDVSALAAIGTSVFAGTGDGVFLTTNAGTNWTQVNNGLGNKQVRALFVLNTHLFAGTDSGIYYSANLGSSWSNAGLGLPAKTAVRALAVCGSDMFAGIHYEPYGVWKRPISQLTGQQEFTILPDFTVYPNPGKNQVQIRFQKRIDQPSEMKLFNLQGQEIISFQVPVNTTALSMDMNAIPAGTYLLRLYLQDGTRLYKKLVVSQ